MVVLFIIHHSGRTYSDTYLLYPAPLDYANTGAKALLASACDRGMHISDNHRNCLESK